MAMQDVVGTQVVTDAQLSVGALTYLRYPVAMNQLAELLGLEVPEIQVDANLRCTWA
jgi:hypothetical protein